MIDPKLLRDALGSFTTGVAVVTTVGDHGAPVGLTVNSFNSVSLSPPLILWSLACSAPSFMAFRNHESFAINILAEDQLDLCHRFARPSDNKFEGVRHRAGLDSVPLLEGSTAQFECRTYARYPGGDHEIYLGEVLNISTSDKPALVFYRGQFTKIAGTAA